GLVGCANTLVDLLMLNGLLWLWPTQNTTLLLLINTLAYTTGALNSFLLNRCWTFRQWNKVNRGEVTRFAALTLAGIFCNDLILYMLNSTQYPSQFGPILWTNLIKIAAISGTLMLSYLGMSLWVFVQSSLEVPGQSCRISPVRQRKRGAHSAQVSLQTLDAPHLTTYSLSLVLPAYNEEQIIAATVEQAVHILAERVSDFEIVVVNDGSADRTGPILAELSTRHRCVRVVTHQQNQGYGATLADGFAAATKALTCFMDADGQFDIHDLDRLLPFIQEYSAVIGYRIQRQDTWVRKLNAWGWKLVVYLALGVRVRDIDCAFKILRTTFLHEHPLETRGAMINAELLYKLKNASCTIREVGVRHLPRRSGRATGANLRVIGRAFRELFLYAHKWRQAELTPQHSFSQSRKPSNDAYASQKENPMYETDTLTAIHHSRPQNRQDATPRLKQRLALLAVMITSIFMNFYQLGQNGFGNLFYAAGVRSMADNLHNFFFVSYDPGGFVTVDKPPLGFWLQTLSVKLFGFTPFSIFFPQALAGVLAVLVLFHLVRRHFGYAAGLLAALALALSPLSVATARNNTIDSTLVLLLLLGAWACMLAAETGKWRWLLLSAGLVGLGFNVKMMEAYLVVPAFGLLYLLAAPRKLWLRLAQLLVALLFLLTVSLSWAVTVDLTPASQRPYVGSSQNNSEISLAFGYNGIDRLLGRFGLGSKRADSDNTSLPGTNAFTRSLNGKAADNSGQRTGQSTDQPGILRLFNENLGGQISWLLPCALLALLALAWQHRPSFKKDRQQQSLLLWGTWLVTMGIFFSVASFFHAYYMTTFAPAICALFGIGIVVMWRDYRLANWRGWLLPIALVASAVEQIHFILSNPAWGTWLIPLIAIPCVLVALILSGARLLMHHSVSQRVLVPLLSLSLAALLLTPAIWSAMPALQNSAIRTPSARPGTQGDMIRDDNSTANPALIRYLEAHAGHATFLAAAPSSRVANALILATNQPVMAMGGFAGSDPILTAQQLSALISKGTVRFFLLNNPAHPSLESERRDVVGAAQNSDASSLWFGRNSQTVLTTWVAHHCALVPTDQWQSGSTNNASLLYDCSAGK
ncbi:MAG TPA: glycosyltransferase family 39 protein, partial [Ktedonobacteraceae bacterium]